MQLSLLVALVAAIVVSENAPHEPVDAGRLRLCLALAGGLGVMLLAAVGSRAIARAIDRDQDRRLTWLRSLRDSSRSIWAPGWLSTGIDAVCPGLAPARALQLGSRSCHPGQGPAGPGADLDAACCSPGPPFMKWTWPSTAALTRACRIRHATRPRSRRGAVMSGCTRATISGWGSCPSGAARFPGR